MLKSMIEMENFFHFFQPIFNIQRMEEFGYEGLLRTAKFTNIEETFSLAKKERQLYKLDSGSMHKAVNTYHRAGLTTKDCYLFLNAFPSTILNTNFLTFIKEILLENHCLSHQLIIEVSEKERIDDFSKFKQIINDLRSEGIQFAIDDMGKGNSNLQTILELEPEYIKLDKYFSKELDSVKSKQKIIKLLLQYCKSQNINLVLEGLETENELATAKSMGVEYAQGFVLGKPKSLRRKEVFE